MATVETDNERVGIVKALEAIREALLKAGEGEVTPGASSDARAASVSNLRQYAVLRRFDLTTLQRKLTQLGFSSLDHIESNVLASIDAVIFGLRCSNVHLFAPSEGQNSLALREPTVRPQQHSGLEQLPDIDASDLALQERTEQLLGPGQAGRPVQIMVTLPAEAAADYGLVRDLLARGATTVRINCAQGDIDVWRRMIKHVRRAEKETAIPCRIMMDLAGPKLRTGPAVSGSRFVRIRPERDQRGVVVKPALVWLATADEHSPDEDEPFVHLPVDRNWLGYLKNGDRITFRDMRGRKRRLTVARCLESGCWATVEKRAFIETGTELGLQSKKSAKAATTRVGLLPRVETPIVLKEGELLVVRGKLKPARPAESLSEGGKKKPAAVSCTLPEVFGSLHVGDEVGFDDGRADGIIEEVDKNRLIVRITHADANGTSLHAYKSINFPNRKLKIPSLTRKDLDDLDFVSKHADIVGASFVRCSEDLARLQTELEKRDARHLGILLKIENKEAYQHLEELLLTLLRWETIGVIVARGDLAVECGLENIAEIQEVILRFCTAGHIPVVVATQILENLSKRGRASRAEINDATVAARAQCILLNKGPHIGESIRLLVRLLERIQKIRPQPYSLTSSDVHFDLIRQRTG